MYSKEVVDNDSDDSSDDDSDDDNDSDDPKEGLPSVLNIDE